MSHVQLSCSPPRAGPDADQYGTALPNQARFFLVLSKQAPRSFTLRIEYSDEDEHEDHSTQEHNVNYPARSPEWFPKMRTGTVLGGHAFLGDRTSDELANG